jgi:hypothetical protein
MPTLPDTNVCPCDLCPPAECACIALINRLRARAATPAAVQPVDDDEDIFG